MVLASSDHDYVSSYKKLEFLPFWWLCVFVDVMFMFNTLQVLPSNSLTFFPENSMAHYNDFSFSWYLSKPIDTYCCQANFWWTWIRNR